MGLGDPRELACLFHCMRTQGKSLLMKQKLISHQAPNQQVHWPWACQPPELSLSGYQFIIFFHSQPSYLRAQIGSWQLCLVYSLSPQFLSQPSCFLLWYLILLTSPLTSWLTPSDLHHLWNLRFVTSFPSWLNLCFVVFPEQHFSQIIHQVLLHPTLNLDLNPTC